MHRNPWVWLIALAVSCAGGLLDATHAYIGSRISEATALPLHLINVEPTFLAYATRSLPSWMLLGLFVPVIFAVAGRFPLTPRSWRRTLPIHVLAGLLFAAVYVLCAAGIRYWLFLRTDWTFGAFATRYYAVYYNTFFLQYWYVTGLHTAILYYRRFQRRELVDAELRARLSEARLANLRSQLRPHFLFNTLNTISVLALEADTVAVRRMLGELADLLRMSFAHDGAEKVTLDEELHFVQRYLSLQRMRFEDRLTVDFAIDPSARPALVPGFLLQPLVENALRHGIAPHPRPGTLRIEGRRVDEWLELSVTDTGPGFLDGVSEGGGGGVGLSNTRHRLHQLFGTSHRFVIGTGPEGGAQVTIRIPYGTRAPEPEESCIPLRARSRGETTEPGRGPKMRRYRPTPW